MKPPTKRHQSTRREIAREESILNAWLDDPGPYMILAKDPLVKPEVSVVDDVTSAER